MNQENKTIIYGREGCYHCQKAKEILNNLKVPYVYKDVDKLSKEEFKVVESETNVLPLVKVSATFTGPEVTQLKHFFCNE